MCRLGSICLRLDLCFLRRFILARRDAAGMMNRETRSPIEFHAEQRRFMSDERGRWAPTYSQAPDVVSSLAISLLKSAPADNASKDREPRVVLITQLIPASCTMRRSALCSMQDTLAEDTYRLVVSSTSRAHTKLITLVRHRWASSHGENESDSIDRQREYEESLSILARWENVEEARVSFDATYYWFAVLSISVFKRLIEIPRKGWPREFKWTIALCACA